MAEAKTGPTGASVEEFIAGVEPVAKRDDALVLLDLFTRGESQANIARTA